MTSEVGRLLHEDDEDTYWLNESGQPVDDWGYVIPADEDEYWESEDTCTNPGGHVFQCTGTQYGGDDPRWFGEGRCLCIHCGADGDA